MTDNNPLLSIAFLVPFDQVRAEHVAPGVAQLLADATRRIEVIVADSAPRTYANTMLALE